MRIDAGEEDRIVTAALRIPPGAFQGDATLSNAHTSSEARRSHSGHHPFAHSPIRSALRRATDSTAYNSTLPQVRQLGRLRTSTGLDFRLHTNPSARQSPYPAAHSLHPAPLRAIPTLRGTRASYGPSYYTATHRNLQRCYRNRASPRRRA